MENEALYLCCKTASGTLIPVFKLNGSTISKKEELGGGSSITMDSVLANINTAKLDERCKKEESNPYRNTAEEPVTEIGGGIDTEPEVVVPTINIADSMDRIYKANA